MASPTPNKGYTYPAHGGSVNAWDTPLNADFDQIDLNVGGFYLITASSTTAAVTFSSNAATVPSSATSITPNTSIAQNLTYRIAGTITSTMTMLLPTVGSFYIIDNQTSSGTFKVNTTAGTSAVTIATGGNNIVYTSTYASNSANIVGQFQAKLYTQLGTPNSNVAGTAGNANAGLTDTVWDVTNKILYVCATTGTSATAVWRQLSNQTPPQGYLTLSTDANNPIISSDYASKTAVYYTPFTGGWTQLSDGTAVYPYQFSQLALSLTAAHAANSIYDVFIYNSTGGVIIGTGPAWTTATAGSGARGSGAGTTQLSRLNGVWTNAVQATLTNGATTFTCPVNQGIYLGSLFIDSVAGNVTCHRSYGQSRKWGVWNNYNRQDIILIGGDPTSSWAYATASFRVSNGSTSNTLTSLTGLSEESVESDFHQRFGTTTLDTNTQTMKIALGLNSTTTTVGTIGIWDEDINNGTGGFYMSMDHHAQYLIAPSLGINTLTGFEYGAANGGVTFFGTETHMRLTAKWRG